MIGLEVALLYILIGILASWVVVTLCVIDWSISGWCAQVVLVVKWMVLSVEVVRLFVLILRKSEL